MRIKCPDCNTYYDVKDTILADNAKVKCRKCGKVWLPSPSVSADTDEIKNKWLEPTPVKTTLPPVPNTEPATAPTPIVSSTPEPLSPPVPPESLASTEPSANALPEPDDATLPPSPDTNTTSIEALVQETLPEESPSSEEDLPIIASTSDEEPALPANDLPNDADKPAEEAFAPEENEDVDVKDDFANYSSADVSAPTPTEPEKIPDSIINFSLEPSESTEREPLNFKEYLQKIVIVLFALSVLSGLWFGRFAISGALPFVGSIYGLFGINVNIPGYGLVFQNISQRMIIEDDVNVLEISGAIANTTDSVIALPMVKVSLKDASGIIIQEEEKRLKQPSLSAQMSFPFTIKVAAPSVVAKNIEITFSESK